MDAVKNFAKGNLTAGISNVATSLTLATGKGALFPASAFNATLWNSTDYSDPADDPGAEIVRVTAGFGTDSFTITRAQEGTVATNHNTAGKTYTLAAGPTAKIVNDTNRTIISSAAFSSHTGIVSGVSDNLVIPAGTLEVGDMVIIDGLWKHTGAMVAAPRFGIDFGGFANVLNLTAVSSGDTYAKVHAEVFITGATAQDGWGQGVRLINGTIFGTNAGAGSEAISGAITVKFTYRMDATGENIQLMNALVQVIKKAP